MDPNKEKALQAALGQIERQFGKGTVMRMGDKEQIAIPSISTGSLGLDVALGIGGLPKGRIVEIYGPESSGKTTLTLQVIAEAQKQGGTQRTATSAVRRNQQPRLHRLRTKGRKTHLCRSVASLPAPCSQQIRRRPAYWLPLETDS